MGQYAFNPKKACCMMILIDAGHGGINYGKPETPGKRATFEHSTIYEGVLNRAVASLLQFELSIRNIPSHLITDANEDIALHNRVQRVNNLIKTIPNQYLLLSIHHNAADDPDANGFEAFTSPGDTRADQYANLLCDIFKKKHPKRKLRRGDKQLSKQANFQILNKTNCPAILTEFSFMTNPDEFDYMTKHNGIQDEVNLFVHWIDQIINE